MKQLKNITPYIFLFLSILGLFACDGNKKEKITHLVKKWQGKEIVFPASPTFTKLLADTVDFKIPDTPYKILIYVDSIGCTSCKLQLDKWKKLIAYTDSLTDKQLPYIFFFHPKSEKELRYLFRRDKFDYPVCIDRNDELNKLNHFPSNMSFQTFLLDKNNKVTVIGNPIHNLAVKELYIKQITGNPLLYDKYKKTTAELNTTEINLGSFKLAETRKASFILKNTGNYPLVIIDASTTCGCATVSFDKHPAKKDETLQVDIDMTPKEVGHFNETITIKCNTEHLIKLRITGQALQ
ncbi:DUF1573 domain-containing protein [Parabacteroides bouchesdurhonensis]|uniref:DUF1573 domain-containing protein n=1 Tax=Parabacteroides bouchesdurhonensis TaxID=1936995 RepID=UPI000C83CC33|nr:DUF1573 domain-containing protein [Parabacteroides bouchesdurhonensis]RHJ92978.1 DUF1573 domain-containing protein [Bacteroides sp. AM07-16]